MNIDIRMPSAPEDIPVKAFRRIALMIHHRLDEGVLLAQSFLLLCPVKLKQWKANDPKETYRFRLPRRGWYDCIPRYHYLTAEEVLSFAKSNLSFLLEDDFLTTNPLTTIRLRKNWHSLPVLFKSADTLLSDCSWAQFKFAETYLEAYIATNDRLHRNMFLATLYSRRRRYVENNLIKRGFKYEIGQEADYQLFDQVSDIDFFIITLFWNGCQSYLRSVYEHLYGSGKKGKQVDHYADNAKNIVTIMDRLKCSEKEVYDTHHTTILETLNRMVYESKEIEKIRAKK